MLKAFGLVGICCYANLPNELQADGALPAHHVDRPVCRVPVSVSVQPTFELRIESSKCIENIAQF